MNNCNSMVIGIETLHGLATYRVHVVWLARKVNAARFQSVDSLF
jgi:hypothetical protein